MSALAPPLQADAAAEPLAVPRTAARADAPTRGRDPAISISGLHKHFGDRQVLRGLSLEVARGSFIAIVGRSGCGKSTLLRILARLETHDGGALRLGASSGPQPDIRLMFQDARLLPWKSVIDNVRLGLPRSALPAAAAALRDVGLQDRARDWPAALSGGQRQRVALARALVHRPQLLLLDEPLGALDALTRIEMHALIEQLWREHGFTALLVTHDVQEAVALADRVIVIEDGVIGLDQAIDLPRPRMRASPQFAALESRVLTQVLQQPQTPVSNAHSADAQTEGLRYGSVRWAI